MMRSEEDSHSIRDGSNVVSELHPSVRPAARILIAKVGTWWMVRRHSIEYGPNFTAAESSSGGIVMKSSSDFGSGCESAGGNRRCLPAARGVGPEGVAPRRWG